MNTPRATAKAFAALVQSRLDSLLDLTDGQLKAKAVEFLMQLQLRVEPAVLQSIVADVTARASLRAGALKMLASTGDFGPSLDLALDKKSPAELRREAQSQTLPKEDAPPPCPSNCTDTTAWIYYTVRHPPSQDA